MGVRVTAFVLVVSLVLIATAQASVVDTRPAAAFLGDSNCYIIRNDGSMWAWGNNNNGQLGDGTAINRYAPVLIMNHSDLLGGNFTGVTDLKSGLGYTLALKEDGTVWSAGANDFGELGDPGRVDKYVFGQVPNVSAIAKISAGESHAMAMSNDGTVWTWGENSFGQLGNGSNAVTRGPVHLNSLSNIRSIAAGSGHSVATRGIETYAWGDNKYGQLGDNSTKRKHAPVLVPIKDVADVAAGDYHTLALMDDSTVMAWGGNDYGQLGNSKVSVNGSTLPVQVDRLRNVKQIAASGRYSMALKYDKTVWAWGYNGNGVLGNWTADDNRHPEPEQIKGLYDIVSIQATPTGCLAIDIYGNVWAWGDNNNGQLGDGTRISRYAPFPWISDAAPWWTGFDRPVTPTPVPTNVAATPMPTPTPAPGPGAIMTVVAIAAGLFAVVTLRRS